MWPSLRDHDQALLVLPGLLGELDPDERARFFRGKRADLARIKAGGGFERSHSYAISRALPIAVTLHRAGLVDLDRGWRDTTTGRRVKTLVCELARLPYDSDDDLLDVYRILREHTLAEAREILAVVRADSVRSSDTSEELTP